MARHRIDLAAITARACDRASEKVTTAGPACGRNFFVMGSDPSESKVPAVGRADLFDMLRADLSDLLLRDLFKFFADQLPADLLSSR